LGGICECTRVEKYPNDFLPYYKGKEKRRGERK
jgi:hypothetical protein